MPTLQKIRLRNLGPHAALEFDFHPRLTFICGENGAGKSWIVRAVWWVLANQPRGTDMIAWGADAARVDLKLGGRAVTRYRGPDANSYRFDGEDYHSLDAAAVPQTIASFLNIGGDNLQGQLDPPYWFLNTPGQVARDLNAIINLQDIDDAQAFVGSAVRKARSTVQVSEGRLKEAKAKRDELAWVRAFDADLRNLERIAAELDAVRHEELSVMAIMDEVVTRQAELARYDAFLDAADSVLTIGRGMVETTEGVDALSAIVERLRAAERSLPDLPDLGPILRQRQAADEMAETVRTLEQTLDEIRQAEETLCQLDEDHAEAMRNLETASGGVCPVCGEPASPSRLLRTTSTCPPDAPPDGARATFVGLKRKKAT